MQPGGDGRLTPEGVGGPVGGHQGILNGVCCFLAVAEGAQRHCPEPVAVPAYELAEGVGFSLDVPGQEILVVGIAKCDVVVQR
ncbi:hypothetical protein GCM10018773_16710 [Streptomyces candidus]|nr:hypothetical protein GCM10018773_16710 [Streptomyces candidus]